ncbi:MAG: hypothetical protein KBC02_03525 [Candidatus Pacebacteria bacterium]|nr:hypothetical protein [Candidatus Paceibacterota bacterium]
MKIEVLKLGTLCQDIATELTGTLTHWVINLEMAVFYIFQPCGLNERGLPIAPVLLERARLKVKKADLEEVEVPFEILGSIVTDTASGYTGMATDFIRHRNGCFHVSIQPAGVIESTNTPIEKLDFDLRQCKGKRIIKQSPEVLKRSIESNPSPTRGVVRRAIPASLSRR